MKERKISQANFRDTGYSYTLSLIAGKYKPIVLYCLMEYEPVRFNEMRRYLGSVSDKTLSQTLKELERDGLIHREMYPEIPPKVEYTLTGAGAGSALHLGRGKPTNVKSRQDRKVMPVFLSAVLFHLFFQTSSFYPVPALLLMLSLTDRLI